ncbi:type II toxin-antitoxin system RelE/ParE family toxin [Clostridium perfringens]|nr:type II toxin-antitoxin system RelE/ParE family toxin [Clostridium perfringens]
MKVYFHESLGGVSCINKFSKQNDFVSLLVLFKGLNDDAKLTLEVSDIKQLKGINPKIYEIRKRGYRIFYTIKDSKLTILDIVNKKKNHTEKVIINRIKKRVKDI